MNESDFLLWVRGPGFTIAMTIFIAGVLLRFLEIFLLGRKIDYSAPRSSGIGAGFKTLVSRSWPAPGMFQRASFTIVAGYVFHIGLLIVLFLLVPHISLIEAATGLSWPGLPTPLVDFFAALALIALSAILWHRLTHPVLRLLSTGEDYLVWAVTFLPLLTGYLTYHHLFFSYTGLLAAHILSAELLLVVFPFTKLMHTFTLFIARWYNGMFAGRKGVES